MELYIGIDDHASTCSYAVMDAEGRLLQEGTVETALERLRGILYPLGGRRYVVVENGVRAEWLYHGLRSHCEDILVANLCGLGKYRKNKSDKLDARELADLRRLGVLRAIYHHSEEALRALKQAVRGYEQVVGDVVRCKNRIKAVYRSLGIDCPGEPVYQKRRRQRWLSKLKPVGHRRRAERLLEELDLLVPLKQASEREMIQAARKRRKEYSILRSVEGIGPVRAAQLLGHIGNPARIRNKRALWRMSGLAVLSRSSSDYALVNPRTGEIAERRRVQTRGLNPDCNRRLKAIFKSAALTAIQQGRVFKVHYECRVERGMRPAMARLTIARKLSAALLACWKKGEQFNPDLLKRPPG